jgi:hypothetical protein
MTSLKTLLLTKSIIAAAAIGGIAAAAGTASAVTIDQANTPNDGVVCHAGYIGALKGSSFICSKATTIAVVKECTNPTFPNYVTRVKNGSKSTGEDLCQRNGISISSNLSLAGFTLDQDYVLASVNLAPNRIANMEQAEAAALGLKAGEVETTPGTPTVTIDGGIGGKDNAILPVTHFVFAQRPTSFIPTGGSFVPRPLP